MDTIELEEILSKHILWLDGSSKGKPADLSGADLSYANLSYASLSGANLRRANLSEIKYNSCTSFLALQCPEKGSFIGYKKCQGKLVKIMIVEDAKRSSATSRKCRCSKAKVLEIENGLAEISSDFDNSFIYKVGEIVEVNNFDENRWNECAAGIHFFITQEEAKNY